MKKFIFIAFVLLLAAVTNPSKDQYAQWATQSMQGHSNNTDIIETVANFSISLIGPSLVKQTTQVQDMMFFTIFTTKTGMTNDFVVIGIFKTFIPISGSL